MKNKHLALHDLMIEFQRVQQFTALSLGSKPELLGAELSHTEESVLFVLDADGKKNIKEISELVGLERSWLSRTVTALENKKYIRTSIPDFDKRSKDLSISALGKKQLAIAEQVAKEIMKESLTLLNQAETSSFQKSLKLLADGLGARDFKNHSAAHLVSYQLGRIGAAVGNYGRGLFGTDFTPTQVHIFIILEKNQSSPLQVKELSQALPHDMSTVSRCVQNLVNSGLLEKNKSVHDKRSVSLHITEKGHGQFKSYKEHAVKILSAGLKKFSVEQLDSLIKIYQKITLNLPIPTVKTHRTNLSLRSLCVSSKDKTANESKILTKLKVNTKNDVISYGAYQGEKLVAAAAAEYTESKKINSISLVNNGAKREECIALIEECLR